MQKQFLIFLSMPAHKCVPLYVSFDNAVSRTKSAVRILSLIIIIMFGILITFPHIFPAVPWILMELALAVTMLLFFNKIHKGYQFPAQL